MGFILGALSQMPKHNTTNANSYLYLGLGAVALWMWSTSTNLSGKVDDIRIRALAHVDLIDRLRGQGFRFPIHMWAGQLLAMQDATCKNILELLETYDRVTELGGTAQAWEQYLERVAASLKEIIDIITELHDADDLVKTKSMLEFAQTNGLQHISLGPLTITMDDLPRLEAISAALEPLFELIDTTVQSTLQVLDQANRTVIPSDRQAELANVIHTIEARVAGQWELIKGPDYVD